jgi:hypothetical protein
MSRKMPGSKEKDEPSRMTPPGQEETRRLDAPGKPCTCDESEPGAFRFDDPYWDDAFDSYHSSTLRTCCLIYR